VKVQLMLTVAALGCGAVFAQDQPPAGQTQATDDSTSSIFSQLDTNHDGRISAEEAQASSVVARSFAKADANGDGGITKEEFMSAFTTRAPTTPPPAVPPSPNPQ
jgi:Ca2+-binding EF-hand superfamily protein